MLLFAFFMSGTARGETVRFRSSGADPVQLAGDYSAPSSPRKPFLVLLHGLGSSRGEWQPLVHLARARGWGTLAYDLRGHGESRTAASGRTVDYSDARFGRDAAFWRAFPDDLLRVMDDLQARGFPPGRLVLAGASLGANVCLLAAEQSEPAALVLMSPGMDYAGLRPEAAMTRVRAPVLLVASRPDSYAFSSAERLAELARGRAEFFALDRGGPRGPHGVQMFDGDLEKRILDWTEKSLESVRR
jgi:pimeloyl-ACP methyl ester carboxylesterase